MHRRQLIALAAIGIGRPAAGADLLAGTPAFVHDTRVEQIAEAYAKGAVDDARDKRAIALDGSEKSVQWVERLLAKMHDVYAGAQAKPSEEVVMSYAKAYGSYIGEVYRTHHGGQWGIVTIDGQSFPGMQAGGTGQTFWPWVRVRKRIVDGPDNNVADYYAVLVKTGEAASAPAAAGP